MDDAVAGEADSVQRIAGYLSKVPHYLKQPPKIEPPPPKHKVPHYKTPEEHQFFNVFPRETVEGERKVPFFVRANGFPMVRWKKPQPYTLTRTLRGLIKGKIKNVDYQQDYEEVYIPMAKNEDVWENIIGHQTGIHENVMFGGYTKDAVAGLNVIKEIHRARHRRTMEKAHKMVAIVEREQELADKEKVERTDSVDSSAKEKRDKTTI